MGGPRPGSTRGRVHGAPQWYAGNRNAARSQARLVSRLFVWVPGMAESLPSPLPPQRKRESSRGARAGVWGGEGISSGGVAGSLSCAGDGNEPPPHWFQFHFFSQKLVITIAFLHWFFYFRFLFF
uniref:Uncharacterized protein n=1 Tax=Sus scrofa TaxID=9823 RepID=A0A8D1L1Y2_PIG